RACPRNNRAGFRDQCFGRNGNSTAADTRLFSPWQPPRTRFARPGCQRSQDQAFVAMDLRELANEKRAWALRLAPPALRLKPLFEARQTGKLRPSEASRHWQFCGKNSFIPRSSSLQIASLTFRKKP